MSKNMTRKGLAFGAGLALTGSALVVAPAASAAENLTLTPDAGTGYNVVTSTEFVLETGFASSITTDAYKYLKYNVVNDGESELVVDMQRGTSADGEKVTQIDSTAPIATAATSSELTGVVYDIGDAAGDAEVVDDNTATITVDETFSSSNSIAENAVFVTDGLAPISGELAEIEDVALSASAEVNSGSTITFDQFAATFSDAFADLAIGSDESVTPNAGTLGEANVSYDETDGTVSLVLDDDLSSLISNGDTIYVGDLTYSSIASDIESAIDEKFHEVTANSGKRVEFKVADDLNTDADDVGTVTAGTVLLAESPVVDDDNFVVGPHDLSGVPAGAQGVENTFIMSTNDFNKDTTVTVQAWLDIDNDNKIDPGEDVSPVRTITFYDRDNVTGTAALEAPVLGASALTANVTFSPELNTQQLDSDDVVVKFLENNTVADVTTGGGGVWTSAEGDFRASYDSVEGVFDADLTGLTNSVVDGTIYGAQVYFYEGTGSTGSASSYEKSGTANFGGVDDGEVATLDEVTLVKGEFANGSGASSKVRSGSGSLTVETAVATVVSGASVAGQTVTLTITDSALTAGASVTAGGSTLTSTTVGDKITVTGVSDADGEVSFDLTYAGFDETDGDAFTVEASALGDTAIIYSDADGGTADLTFTAEDSVGTELADNIAGDGQLATAINSNFSVSYTLVDQFGQTPVGEFRLVITENGSDSGDADYTDTLAVSNGTATFTQLENSSAANDYVLTATVQKKNTSGVFQNLGASVTETTEISANTALPTPLAITGVANDTTSVALTLADMVNLDEDIAQSSVAYPATQSEYIEGTVTGSGGAPLKGVEVTLSSANIQFTTEDDLVHGAGSITVTTGTDGKYKVYIASRIAGDQTITVTSGSVSVTEVVNFAPASADTGTTLNISAPEVVNSGSTLVFTGSLVDKYGNPVDSKQGASVGVSLSALSVTYSGPGLTVGDLPTETDANGEFTVRVLMGSGDTGSGTLTVVYGGDDGKINAVASNSENDDNIAAAKTVTIGSTYGTMNAWTVNQNDGTAKVYVKFPTIGEKVRIGHQTGGSGSYETIFVKTLDSETDSALTVNVEGSYIVRTIDLEDGTNRIRVTVGDSTEVQVRYNE